VKMPSINQIPAMKPYFSADSRSNILEGIDNILQSGRLMMGDYTKAFEEKFADYVHTEFAISVNSCTTALQICLQYYGAAGREVLVPSGTFRSAVSSIRWADASPVLVDMNPETLSFDLTDLQNKITPNTVGIMWVHLTGMITSEYLAVKEIAKDNDLFLLEDCAHAHGATVGTEMAGSLADAGCFSFYPTKLMTTGTGGMITTNDRELAQYARSTRLFGQDPVSGKSVPEGGDWFLDEIRACVGFHQLADIPNILTRRRKIADEYTAGLAGKPGIKLLPIPEGHSPSYYQFPIFVDPAIDRDELISRMSQRHGIHCKEIYAPIHQLDNFKNLDDGTLSKTQQTLERAVCLPMFFDLTSDQVATVIAALASEVDAMLQSELL